MRQAEVLFTSSDKISVSREGLDVAIFDEGIASAISEEKSTADGLLAGDRKLIEGMNEARPIHINNVCFLNSSLLHAAAPPHRPLAIQALSLELNWSNRGGDYSGLTKHATFS